MHSALDAATDRSGSNLRLVIMLSSATSLLQDDLLLEGELPGAAADDALPSEDDELDASPCMLPLVRLIERAAELSQPGGMRTPLLPPCYHSAARPPIELLLHFAALCMHEWRGTSGCVAT